MSTATAGLRPSATSRRRNRLPVESLEELGLDTGRPGEDLLPAGGDRVIRLDERHALEEHLGDPPLLVVEAAAGLEDLIEESEIKVDLVLAHLVERGDVDDQVGRTRGQLLELSR